MAKVIWNNGMDICIGLYSELTKKDFIEEIIETHKMMTGEDIRDDIESGIITLINNLIWQFEY